MYGLQYIHALINNDDTEVGLLNVNYIADEEGKGLLNGNHLGT